MLLCCLQAAELRRLNSERAQQQLDVSRVEAEDQEVVVRNNALNKQQAALQAEVRLNRYSTWLPYCSKDLAQSSHSNILTIYQYVDYLHLAVTLS